MRVQDIGLKTKKKSPSKKANKMCFQQDDFKKRGSEGAYTKEILKSKFVAELEFLWNNITKEVPTGVFLNLFLFCSVPTRDTAKSKVAFASGI